jgi:short subunit dehydrogenase-like uncharacterized protein
MSDPVLIYGAYGYTGRLIVAEALAAGLRPILGGRRADQLTPLAAPRGLEQRDFSLDHAAAVDAALAGVAVVIHCAGPFSQTALPMAEACLRTGVHYTDITGEAAVFEALAAMHQAAMAAKVMLLPGAGFDVVPSDCLALHLKQCLPSATELRLAFHSHGRASHGTQATIVENLGQGGLIRREGVLTRVPHAWHVREVDFGSETRTCMTIPWGDVCTAFHSTGIPNIEVYMSAPLALRSGSRYLRHLGWLMNRRPVQTLLKRRIPQGGPSDAERAAGYCLLWGEVRDASGGVREARLRTAEGYTLTAATAVIIARKILAGQWSPGFQTPAKQYGADLILEAPGSVRG